MISIQQCLQDVIREGNVTADSQVNVKVNKQVKEAVEEICHNHNITMSSFLRKCMENLVREYRDVQISN